MTLAVSLVWLMVVFAAFRPGLLSPDSISQLSQGLEGAFANTHPPLLSWLAGRAFQLASSPWPLLLLQLVTLVLAHWLLVPHLRPNRLQLMLLAGFVVLPTYWSIANTIWKDVAVAVFLLFAVVGLARASRLVTIVCLLLAVCSRHNALLAAIPLLVALALQSFDTKRARAAFIGIGLVTLVTAPLLSGIALQARNEFVAAWLYTDDLAGIYQRRPALFRESMFADKFSAEKFGALYRKDTSWPIFYGGPPESCVDLEALEAHRATLRNEWLSVIGRAPIDYAAVRLTRFACLLGLQCPDQYLFHEAMTDNPWGLELAKHTAAYQGLRAIQVVTKATPLFRGWFWLLSLLCLTAFAVRNRGALSLEALVGASGLLYFAGYLIIGPAADFRYLFWCVICCSSLAIRLVNHGETGSEFRKTNKDKP